RSSFLVNRLFLSGIASSLIGLPPLRLGRSLASQPFRSLRQQGAPSFFVISFSVLRVEKEIAISQYLQIVCREIERGHGEPKAWSHGALRLEARVGRQIGA